MGFASLIKDQVQSAMRILGQQDGLAPAHTYVATDTSASVYNPATGSMEDVSTEYDGVPMVLTRFKIEEMDDNIVPTTDLKVLIAANDIPVEPTAQDLIYMSTGQTYMVERVLGVPGESLHILHVRRTRRPS